MFKLCIFLLLLSSTELALAQGATTSEDWKGPASDKEISVGVQTGLGIYDGAPGFGLGLNVGKKILNQGFAPEINNQVFIEGLFGPLYVKRNFTFFYSLHLRWDFHKDDRWILFAIGGIGGNVTGAALYNRWDIYPRFGIGAFWNLDARFRIRGEISHEFTSLGINFLF